MFSSGEKRSGLTERDCQISESVQYTFTAEQHWNNSYVRCVARNSTDIVSASVQKRLILQTPGMHFVSTKSQMSVCLNLHIPCQLRSTIVHFLRMIKMNVLITIAAQ